MTDPIGSHSIDTADPRLADESRGVALQVREIAKALDERAASRRRQDDPRKTENLRVVRMGSVDSAMVGALAIGMGVLGVAIVCVLVNQLLRAIR